MNDSGFPTETELRTWTDALLGELASREWKVPGTIRFGVGAFGHIGRVARSLGSEGPVLVVTGRRLARDAHFRSFLDGQFAGPRPRTLHYAEGGGEPDTRCVNATAELARRINPALVIGVGGGSAIDLSKAVAAMAVNEGPVEDYLEGVGPERKLEAAPIPVVAVPTTAGTGSEMTRNAVISGVDRPYKKSLRDDRMIPAAALVDPGMTGTAPASVTAASGMDAITQLIESCISRKRKGAVTALACRALRWTREALPRCVETPGDLAARTVMSAAAMVSGACLAHAGLAMAHGIAAGLGALHGVPHGVACAILLPHTLRWNRDAVAEDLARAMAALMGEAAPSSGTTDRGIFEIERINARLGLPPDLAFLKLDAAGRESLAGASMGSSMSGNPRPMTPSDIEAFLRPICG
jgi:alcohol dehydrogenase class IV